MPRQNFFKQIIIIVIISVFMAGCNTQVNVFTPTPVVAAPADTETAAPSPTTAPIEVTVRPTNTAEPIAVVTATEAPATAEAPRFTADKVGFIPKDMTEAGMCVEVADPIKEQAKFTADINEIIAATQPLIDAYNGPFLQVGGFGANAFALQVTQDMGVVGCVSFPVEGGLKGVGLVIPFKQPDRTKTAIVGVIDPLQINLYEKNARAPNDILDEVTKTGYIKYDASTGWNEFGFGVDKNLSPDFYSSFTRKYLATRTDFATDYFKCVINK
jgi:hypothetical protein